MSDNTFMGLTIEGDPNSWRKIPQLPVEDLYPHFKAAFDLGVKAVMWEQYTPAFNDGEPCEFGVREPRITTNDVVAAAWLEGEEPDMELAYPGSDNYYDDYDYQSWSSHPDGKLEGEQYYPPVDSAEFEDAVHTTFGNDTKIVVTPTRVMAFEYECGY